MGMMDRIKGRMSRARDRPVKAQAGTAPASTGVRKVRLRSVSAHGTQASVSLTGSEMIYAAVSRIASAIATMPVSLYCGYEIMSDDPRHRMLALRPNEWMSSYDFRRAMEANRNTEGRAYALIIYETDGVTPRSLQLLDPARVRPLIAEETGALWYQITRPDDTTIDYVPARMVIALKHMSTNGLDGLRPLDVLRGALDYDAKIRRISLEALRGVNNGVVLEFPVEMGEEQRTAAVDEFLRVYEASGGNMIALDAGVRATVLNRSAIDPKLFDVERISRSRVATVYMIPPHLLGDYSDTEAGSIEQQTLELISFTLLPIIEQWQQELDYKLLTEDERSRGYRFRFDVNSLRRGDMATVAEYNFKAVRSGWKSPDEIRSEDFLPPTPGGDKPLVSKDLARLEDVAKGATLSAGGKPMTPPPMG